MTTGTPAEKPRTQKRSHRRNPPLSHGTISGVSQAARGPYRETRETGQDQSCVAPGQCAAPGHQGVGPDRKRRAGQENHDHRHECDVRPRLRGQCHVCRLHHGDARSDLLWDSRSKLRIASPDPKGLLGVIQRGDPSFMKIEGKPFTLVNNEGYQVDLIKRDEGYQHSEPGQIWANEEDFWAVKVHNMDWLLRSQIRADRDQHQRRHGNDDYRRPACFRTLQSLAKRAKRAMPPNADGIPLRRLPSFD